MSDALISAANAVATEFMPTENTVGLAAARTARLLATVLEQHARAELSIGTGTVLVRKLAKCLTAQIDAREEFAMAHKLAAALPGELGLDPSMYGDTEPCPPNKALFLTGDNVVHLAA